MSIYLNNPWKPVKHKVFRKDFIADTIHEKGYFLYENALTKEIDALQILFNDTHQFNDADGGMFYSVYSQDLSYRKKIHEEICVILKPFLEQNFHNYKVMINSFVVKLSGPESEFYLHQDTTGLDEWKYSPLNIWIPLQDVDENNGCLGIIEKSHHFFSPYRSISFPAPFDRIQPVVMQYLKPVIMKQGDVLIFDNRTLHNSYKNLSGKTRVAVICGIFPEEASIITCHKPEYKCGGEVELIEHDDDFLLTYPKFLINCQDRPHVGKSIGWKEDPYYEISEAEFFELCRIHRLEKQNKEKVTETSNCKMIAEPITIHEPVQNKKSGIWDKIKEFIS